MNSKGGEGNSNLEFEEAWRVATAGRKVEVGRGKRERRRGVGAAIADIAIAIAIALA